MPDTRHLKRPPMVTAGSSSSSLGTRPQGPLARPSYPRSGSSSSSLSGSEQSVQPFQDFIKQTRAVYPEKPLPPTPLSFGYPAESPQSVEDRRLDSSGPIQYGAGRRSSSVYSRTQSQWLPSEQSEESLDHLYDSYLGSGSHSTGMPGVGTNKSAPESSEPRHCSPLLVSPSPTLSAVSTLTNIRLPTLVLSQPVQERPKARLMSLDKANRTLKAPGMVHLLPEELRAQSSDKSDARKHKRMESEHMLNMFSTPRPPPLPPAAFVHDNKRSKSTSIGASESPYTRSPRNVTQQPSGIECLTSMSTFRVGTGPAREMLPPSTPESLRLLNEGERGRRRERGHSSREYSPRRKFFVHDLNPRPLAEQRDLSPKQISESGSYDSEDDVRGHMKMIPQPLFQVKSPTKHRKPSDARITSPLGYSTLRMQHNSQESTSSGRCSGFPLRLSLTPPPGGIRHRKSKSSTTGMIPISPPSGNDPAKYDIPVPIDTSQYTFRKPKPSHEAKISSLYPRLVSRNKMKKAKPDGQLAAKRPSIGAPLLPPDVVAAVLLTPDTTPQTSPLASNIVLDGLKRAPSGLTAEGKKPLYQRFKGIAKHVGRSSKQQELSREQSPVASPQSPHLLTSPVKTSQPTHLGWTETAKATWDQARATANSMRRTASHTTSPDEGMVEDNDSSGPIASRPTLFGPFVESYRETKAQKRREDLKKTIKVVTPLEEPSQLGESDDERKRDSVIQRRLSGYNWM